MVLAARACPILFNSLILADHVIFPKDIDTKVYDYLRAFIPGAVVRRNNWKSRAVALEALRSRPPFNSWPDEVMNLHVGQERS